MARSYLTNVSKKGILITLGDNDTYPLWYVQEKEGYRTDVIVININFLGLKRYIAWLEDFYDKSLFRLQKKVYFRDDFNVLYRNIQQDCNDSISLTQLIDSVNIEVPYNELYGRLRLFPCKVVTQTIDTKYSKELYPELKNNFSFSLETPQYLFISDLMLLDIFSKTIHTRQLHFTFKNISSLFDPYLKESGLIFKIAPELSSD